MILGITGTFGAGKGTIVDYLIRTKGFAHFSVREYLNTKLAEQKKIFSRENMVELANSLRTKNEASFIVDELYKEALIKGGNCIIESLRNSEEVISLRKKGQFYLFSVDAKPKVRYERIVKRASSTDKVTYKEFLNQEKKELKSKNKFSQNIQKCMEMADYKFDNDGSFDELYQQVDRALEKINNQRPSWDEYFMEVVQAIAKRATCDRGRCGAVIAKDKQLLCSGYVGSPVGLPHCDDVGHQMRQVIHEDGSITSHCVRTVHAEQNAICQAAKRGISIEGATVYTKMTPCRTCAMLIINSGIKRVFCERKYHTGEESEEMFRKAGVEVVFKSEEMVKYKNM